MKFYPKIQSIYKRDQKTKEFLMDQWARPEFNYLANNGWEVTEKIDGTNIRIIWNCAEESIFIGGRTDKAILQPELKDRLEELFLSENALKYFKESFNETDVILFGEGYGRKIQKIGSAYKKDGNDFILFDAFVNDRWWLLEDNLLAIAEKLNVAVVPSFGIVTLYDAIDLCKKGFSSRLGNCKAEGIVAKPQFNLLARNGARIIAKIKCKDWL